MALALESTMALSLRMAYWLDDEVLVGLLLYSGGSNLNQLKKVKF